MPKVSLNARFVESIRPEDARVDYWDSDTLGLCLRVTKNGVKTWSIRYRPGGGRTGRHQRFTIGRFPDLGLADARKRARRLFVEIADGLDPAAEREAKRSGDDVEAFAGRWIDHLRDKGRAKADVWARMLEHDVIPVIGWMKPADVKRLHVRQIMDRMKKRGATIQTNRTFELVRAFFRWIGREYDDVLTADPTFGMRKPFDERPRERLLTDDELRRLWAALHSEREVKGRSRGGKAFTARKPLVTEPVRIAILLLMLAGQRASEVCEARVSEFDLAENVWRIPRERTKAQRGQEVPLSPAARALAERAIELADGSPWLFPAAFKVTKAAGGPIINTAANHALKRAAEAAGVEDVRVHDLRRLVASGVARLGFGDDVISALLNHAPKGVTARHYNRHRYEVEKRRALDAWAAHVAAIVEGRQPANNVRPLRRERA